MLLEVRDCCLLKTLPDHGSNCPISFPDQPLLGCTLQSADQAASARGVPAGASGIHYPQLPSTAAQQQSPLYPAVAGVEVPTPQVLSEEDNEIVPDGYTDGSRQDPPAARSMQSTPCMLHKQSQGLAALALPVGKLWQQLPGALCSAGMTTSRRSLALFLR